MSQKIHLYVDCYPYDHKWFIFCGRKIEPAEENLHRVTEKDEEITCKVCKRLNDRLIEKMKKDGLLDKEGNLIEQNTNAGGFCESFIPYSR